MLVRGQSGKKENPKTFEQVNCKDFEHGAFICQVMDSGWLWKDDDVFGDGGESGQVLLYKRAEVLQRIEPQAARGAQHLVKTNGEFSVRKLLELAGDGPAAPALQQAVQVVSQCGATAIL